MNESVQRRAIWLAALTTFVFLVGTLGFGGFGGSASLWRASLFVATVAVLLASVALAGVAYASDGLPSWRLPRAERSLALSFALMWLGLLFYGIQIASAVVQAAGGSGGLE